MTFCEFRNGFREMTADGRVVCPIEMSDFDLAVQYAMGIRWESGETEVTAERLIREIEIFTGEEHDLGEILESVRKAASAGIGYDVEASLREVSGDE